MPVEIREINISMTLLQDNGPGAGGEDMFGEELPGAPSGSVSVRGAEPLTQNQRQELVNACVRSVMQILREKGEA